MRVEDPSFSVHLVRHGEVVSHRGDIPVTEAGLEAARERGRQIAAAVTEGEEVRFLHTVTRRTRQTAGAIRAGMAEGLKARSIRGVDLREPVQEDAIRNPDLYLGGIRVEMVSTPEAMAEQTASVGLSPNLLRSVPFWPAFWESPDAIGHWVAHPAPPGEDAATVATRIGAYVASLRDVPGGRPRRYICVTHSGPMRALLLAYLLTEDPGEPGFVEPIDFTFLQAGTVRVAFRDRQSLLQVPQLLRRRESL